MKKEYELLYREMLSDIDRTMQLELPEKERVESCFWIASNYWEKLKVSLKDKDFRDEAEEIEFFRNVKPQFTHYVDYFVLLTEALMFVPSSQKIEAVFWEQEGNRYKRFYRRNEEFIQYLEKGDCCQDSLYFLRKSFDNIAYGPKAPVHDVDRGFCTSHDPLVRAYLAQKRFYEYTRERVEELKKVKEV